MTKSPAEYQSYYPNKAFKESWPRNLLINKIGTKLFHRKGALSNNFAARIK